MVFNKRNIKSITLIFAVANIVYGQGTASSPFTVLRNNTSGFTGEIHLQTNDGHYFGMQAQTTSAGNVLVGMPNTDPSPGTCLGYVSAHQVGWVACSGSSALDPTLGLLMTNNTNSGVIGISNGAHISWDTSNDWIDIQSWFSGSVAPIHINASRVDIGLLNEAACEGTGCQTQGFRINASNGNNATDTTDGGHIYWDTTNHWLQISPWFGGVAADVKFLNSIFAGNNITVANSLIGNSLILNVAPTLCALGQYARGINSIAGGTGCTAAGTVSSVAISSSTLTVTGSPIVGSGVINLDLDVNPVNGITIVDQTTTGVTGTSNGAHIFWDTTNHWLTINSWQAGVQTTTSFGNNINAGNNIIATNSLIGNSLILNVAPALCPVGQYARGVNVNAGGTGCTIAGGSSLDPTLGLVVVNDSNTNSTSATQGMHIYYDPVGFTGNINVYNSGLSETLNVISSNLSLNSFLMQVNVLFSGSEVDPRLDNSFTLGTSSQRWSDTRSALGHFGIQPGAAIGGGTIYSSCTSICFDDVDAFGNSTGVYWTRSAGGSQASPTAVTINSTLGVFGSSGYDGTSWVGSTTAGMFTQATQTWNSAAHGTNMYFETIQLNSTSPAIRLTIDDTGLTVPAMSTGASRAVCVTSGGHIYASFGLTCP